MWHENLLHIIEEKKYTTKQIADKGNVSEKTVIRIIKSTDNSCNLDTLNKIAIGLDCTLEDILLDTGAIIGGNKVYFIESELTKTKAEKELLLAEKSTLENEIKDLKNEIKLLEKEILHKDEVIALHKIILGLKKD